MKEQFVHTLTNSFMLWFDNFLLKKGEAFSNQTGTFYHTPVISWMILTSRFPVLTSNLSLIHQLLEQFYLQQLQETLTILTTTMVEL